MSEILNAIQGALSIILMIGIGFYLSYKKWFKNDSHKLLSKLVVNVSLPLYMIANLMGSYDKEKLLRLTKGIWVPFLSMTGCYVLGILLARILKIPTNRRGTFCSMFALSNTIFIGLPVNIALFGKESLSYVLLYYIANTVLFWTIGVYGMAVDGGVKDRNVFAIDNLKRIFSPPLLGFITAIILITLNVKLPKSILDTCGYMGNLTTPLSMIFIGIVIQTVNLKDIKMDRGMFTVLLGRFMIAPIIVIALCSGLTLPLLMKKVFVIQAAMPAMTQTTIIAERYGADYRYAAVVTVVTTILSIIFIPVFMLIIEHLWSF